MNILIYSKPFWPSIGGVECGSQLLARSLAEAGHKVTVFTSTRRKGAEVDEGYHVCRSANLSTFVRMAIGADVLMMKGGVSAFAGIGAMVAGIQTVVIWHEMAGPYGHPGSGWSVSALNVIRKKIAQRADFHVGLTKACLASKNLPEGIMQKVIPTPVDEEKFAAGAGANGDAREIDVLFVGRLIEGKGILVLAEAVRKLSLEGNLIRVKIVGEGSDRGRMEAALRATRTLSVAFAGAETGGELLHSYAASKILVVPSTTHLEGQAIVVAEGMAFGLAIVASDQAVLKEVVGDAGVIVTRGDADALASALRTILRDDAQWKELSVRARKRSELFSMANFNQGITELLEEVARRS